MKQIILILLFLFGLNGFSQEYTFERVNIVAENINSSVKTKGLIFISDSLITIEYNKGNEPKQTYYVKKLSDNGLVKQYLSDVEKTVTPYNVRFTFQESNIYNKLPFMLVMDMKDEFTNKVTQMMYFIKLN